MEKLCTTHTGRDPWAFEHNRREYTLEMLEPYQNQWVAWNWNATRILAHHSDPVVLARLLTELGLYGEDFTVEFIAPVHENASQL